MLLWCDLQKWKCNGFAQARENARADLLVLFSEQRADQSDLAFVRTDDGTALNIVRRHEHLKCPAQKTRPLQTSNTHPTLLAHPSARNTERASLKIVGSPTAGPKLGFHCLAFCSQKLYEALHRQTKLYKSMITKRSGWQAWH